MIWAFEQKFCTRRRTTPIRRHWTVRPEARISPDKCLCPTRQKGEHQEVSWTRRQCLQRGTNIGVHGSGWTQKGVRLRQTGSPASSIGTTAFSIRQ